MPMKEGFVLTEEKINITSNNISKKKGEDEVFLKTCNSLFIISKKKNNVYTDHQTQSRFVLWYVSTKGIQESWK